VVPITDKLLAVLRAWIGQRMDGPAPLLRAEGQETGPAHISGKGGGPGDRHRQAGTSAFAEVCLRAGAGAAQHADDPPWAAHVRWSIIGSALFIAVLSLLTRAFTTNSK
jgi:hypothetical protein